MVLSYAIGVAHGQITPAECNLGSTSLVLVMLLRLATSVVSSDPYMTIRQQLTERAKATPKNGTEGATF